MTTRRQVLLAIVPVFAALALVGNGITYFFLSRASLEGLRNEAGAFAVTLAAFKHPGDWQRLQEGRSQETSYPTALKQLDRWDILRGVAIWDARDRQAVYRYPEKATMAEPPVNASTSFTAQKPFLTSPLSTLADGKAVISGYAPLYDNAGNIAAIVGAEIDASGYPREIALIRQRLVRTTLLIVLLGTIVALLLASLISRELGRITRAAAGIEQGHYVPPPPGLVAEVTDLSQTFGVLEGVTEEIRSKSHRAFAENEQFRTEEDLLATYREAFLAPLSLRGGDYAVTVAVTANAIDVFREATADAAGGRVSFGRIEGSVTLEAATIASATGRELEDRLARGEIPAAALTATAALFPLRTATVLTWRTGSRSIERADLAHGNVTTTTLPAPGIGELVVVHNLSPAATEALEIYLARFSQMPVADRVADVLKLSASGNGAVAVLSR